MIDSNLINTNSSINNASQITSRIETLKQSKIAKDSNQTVERMESGLDDISSSFSDPIGGILKKTLFKINNLTTIIETKIDRLAQDAIKAVDNRGTVELIDNSIVITVKPSDLERARIIENNINNNIKSINNNLNVLNRVLSTLTTISNTMNAISTALDIQEVLLNANPVTASTFGLIKKVFKILNLRDTIKEYSRVLAGELLNNRNTVQQLIDRFRGLNIKIVVSDEINKGNFISDTIASEMISNSLINNNIQTEKLYEQYIGSNDLEYILTVENYDNQQNIGRAKEKISGFLAAQTAPSYFATGEELLEELKSIIEINLQN